MAVQILVLLFVIFIVIDSFAEVWKLYKSYRYLNEPADAASIFKILTDIIACAMTMAFVSMRIPTKQASVPESSRLVGAISQIKWESTESSLTQKTEAFFDNLSQMLKLIETDSSLDTFCSFILVVSLLRVIQCTALHPRLALLTGTVAKALDDLWHASLLILLLMTSFAGIATWRFGTIRKDFESLEASLITNFMMMFGNFPNDWNGVASATPLTGELVIYVILYFIVVFQLSC